MTSILAKKLEKKGFENKGYIDMQAGEMALRRGSEKPETPATTAAAVSGGSVHTLELIKTGWPKASDQDTDL